MPEAGSVFSPESLRHQRHANGLSRDELAVGIGRTVSTVTKYELGIRRPSADILGALATALSCQVGDFFDAAEARRDGAA